MIPICNAINYQSAMKSETNNLQPIGNAINNKSAMHSTTNHNRQCNQQFESVTQSTTKSAMKSTMQSAMQSTTQSATQLYTQSTTHLIGVSRGQATGDVFSSRDNNGFEFQTKKRYKAISAGAYYRACMNNANPQ
jgi:hypothetical protein